MDVKLGKSAYIKLRQGSKQQSITLNEVKELLDMYTKRTSKTGEQLDWEYEDSALPYSIEERTENGTKYLFLKKADPLYNYLIIGVGSENTDGEEVNYVQIVLPNEDNITPGDLAKGNEFAKYFAKYLKGELHLFNGRIIYNNDRK